MLDGSHLEPGCGFRGHLAILAQPNLEDGKEGAEGGSAAKAALVVKQWLQWQCILSNHPQDRK